MFHVYDHVCTCVLKHLWKKLKSQFSEQDHQWPTWIWEPFTVLKSSCYWRRQRLFHYVPIMSESHIWTVLQHFSHSLRSFPQPHFKHPKVPTTRNNLAGSYSREGEGREGRADKPKLQVHILEQVLSVFWIKLAFLGWGDPASSVPSLNKKDYIEPQIKYEHIRNSISQFSANSCGSLQAAVSLVWRKENGFICSLAHRKDDIITRVNTNS